ncbi:MAG: copper homeostasis protein CutC [Bacteroidota bacterium]|nr:copper homeostasis protein CutC [Bacteroidota bacterium]
MTNITLEVCAFSFEGCQNARLGGGNRIELCANPAEGGTTPSYGLIKKVREEIDLKLYPLIRPRGGEFYYSNDEFEIMLHDIKQCKQLGCDGIATGVQRIDGNIDFARMRRIVDLAYPMRVTCIRAFDLVPDMFAALDGLIDAGCERVLTSGQAEKAYEAAETIAQLVTYAGDRIIIMPGSGIRPDNIEMLVKTTRATEYHASARIFSPATVSQGHRLLKEFGQAFSCDAQQLKEIRRRAEAAFLK